MERMTINDRLRVWVHFAQLHGTSIYRLTVSPKGDIVRLATRLPSEILFWKDFPDGRSIDLRRTTERSGDLITSENSMPFLSFVNCEKIGFFSNPLAPKNPDQVDAVTFYTIFRCKAVWHFLGET